MLELLIHYKYLAFFIGMIVGGDIVLITGIYLALRNQLDIYYLITLAFLGTIISDVIWYYFGSKITEERLLSQKFIRIKKDLYEAFKHFYEQHGFKALFYSKFIYGTRIVTQMLAGAYKMALRPYLSINSIGTILFILCIVALCYAFRSSIERLRAIVENTQILLLVFVVGIFLLQATIRRLIRQKLVKRLKSETSPPQTPPIY
jgi:membrane protein DedA with SNARE-associated domain